MPVTYVVETVWSEGKPHRTEYRREIADAPVLQVERAVQMFRPLLTEVRLLAVRADGEETLVGTASGYFQLGREVVVWSGVAG